MVMFILIVYYVISVSYTHLNSDDELEKEWKESLQVEGLERVNFSRGVVGGEEKSSRVYLVDESSTNNCPWSFDGVPGRARRCFYDVVVPSAWNDIEKVKWCYDERYFERDR